VSHWKSVLALAEDLLRPGQAFVFVETTAELLVEAIERAGLEPGRDAVIAIDVAAHSLLDPAGGYRLSREDVHRSSGEMLEMVAGWVADFPVVSVEDPLDEDDWAG
jgi:enolase